MERIEGNSLLVFFGFSVILQNVASLIFTPNQRGYRYQDEIVHFIGVTVPVNKLIVLAIAAAVCVAAVVFFRRWSTLGLAIKGVMQQREASALVGIPLTHIELASLCLGFAAAALAGVLVSMTEEISPFMGFPLTVTAFVVVILGGLGRPPRQPHRRPASGSARNLRRGADRPELSFDHDLCRVHRGSAVAPARLAWCGKKPNMTRIGRRASAVTAVALLAISLPFVANSYFVGVGFTLLVWIALTESWIVISGMTGYISLGHVVFVGIGAYVAALAWLVLPIWIILPLAGLTAAVLATLVGYPCLRVRGPYFVILTFGLSELVKYIIVNIESALTVSGRVLFGAPGVETLYLIVLPLAWVSVILPWSFGNPVSARDYGPSATMRRRLKRSAWLSANSKRRLSSYRRLYPA